MHTMGFGNELTLAEKPLVEVGLRSLFKILKKFQESSKSFLYHVEDRLEFE